MITILRCIGVAVGLCALPALAFGQALPVGSEFQVNTYTPGRQFNPDVAMDPAGSFRVVWRSDSQDGDLTGIFAQRYDSGGSTLGSEFQVNTYTGGDQDEPEVASDDAGNFVVVWESYSQYGVPLWDDLAGQRYDSTGNPLGTEFPVNVPSGGLERLPDIASAPTGDFVVVWAVGSAAVGDVKARRFDSAGNPLGGFGVNSYSTGSQWRPAVASDDAGNFVVVWQGGNAQDGDGYGIFSQRYDSAGGAVGTEFQVNTHTTDRQDRAAVALDDTGNFMVAWTSYGQDGDGYGVFAQRHDSAGAAVGTEFQVNTYTTDRQSNPAIVWDEATGMLVVWRSDDQDGSASGIFAQAFEHTGAPLGSEFQVNTYTTVNQGNAAVASDDAGNFVVVWQSAVQDGSALEGVFGQRFAVLTPPATATPTPTETPTATVPTSTHTATNIPTETPTNTPTVILAPTCPTTPLPGVCAAPAKALIKMKKKPGDPSKSKFLWKWLKGTASTPQFGDPTSSTAYTLCVYDDSSPATSLSVMPGGTCGTDPCWKELGPAASPKGYKYKNKATNSDGVFKMLLKEGTGRAKIIVKGKGSSLSVLPPVTQASQVTVQLFTSSTSNCWESVFPNPALKNVPDQFKDKIP